MGVPGSRVVREAFQGEDFELNVKRERIGADQAPYDLGEESFVERVLGERSTIAEALR